MARLVSVAALGALCLTLLTLAPMAWAGTLRVVATGEPAPGGGRFEHFSVESLPIVAPVNGKGQVAFFATILRGAASEGIFLASGKQISKVALEGDRVPGGGTISGFGRHPIPALNEAGAVAFAAAVTSGNAVEGIFVAMRGRLQTIALAGATSPGFPSGTLANLDAPALNDRGDVAFLATVRRGRETTDAVYLWADGKLRKVVAQGDPAPAGGTFAGFGPPALNNKGVIVFGAVVEGRGVPGGVFLAEAGKVKMILGAGEDTPLGGIFAKFSERITLNDAGTVAFHAHLKGAPVQAAIVTLGGGRVRSVATLGDPAPGGGTFSNFGLWPALAADGAVGFTASVDGGASPVGVFVSGPTGITRLVGIGDAAPGGGTFVTLTLYPAICISPTGVITFAAAPSATGEGVEGLYLVEQSQTR
ncbi:MAG TPA: choice-of-anchor tandem repeat NxxGxxAF-containing protein [Candidatus Methylomirabilis sp.]|nr:choice-of-anchor tandem repeat NxxGxxAF-containing protein [Candidatus Methylomirabilis sp.]